MVKRYDVISGGHQWPGSPGGGSGTINNDIDARAEIWNFCKQFRLIPDAVQKPVILPLLYSLSQNYPNPFNPTTTIRYEVPHRSRVRLTVYNILGQQVAELANEVTVAGRFEKIWNADVASGVYFYRIAATAIDNPNKRFVDVKKLLLLK